MCDQTYTAAGAKLLQCGRRSPGPFAAKRNHVNPSTPFPSPPFQTNNMNASTPSSPPPPSLAQGVSLKEKDPRKTEPLNKWEVYCSGVSDQKHTKVIWCLFTPVFFFDGFKQQLVALALHQLQSGYPTKTHSQKAHLAARQEISFGKEILGLVSMTVLR